MNYKLILQYDGTKYSGWQKQGSTNNTIQGKLEHILSKMTDSNIEVHGSGRTDAGVHAYKQTAHFKCNTTLLPNDILHYINQFLPNDIAVLSVDVVSERFHSRLNAKSKKYLYRIYNHPIPNVFKRHFVTFIDQPLDIKKMITAGTYFMGEHDFKSFCSKASKKKSTVRTIYDINISIEDDEIQILIHGNGFLHNMVRIIVGTLIECGLNKIDTTDIPHIINSKDRRSAGFTAPPEGLVLFDVYY